MEEWMDRAACLNYDPELFFSTDKLDIRNAIEICNGCPVIKQCRKFARQHRVSDGVWAGTERSRTLDLRS